MKFISSFSPLLITAAFDLYSPRSLRLTTDYRKSEMLLNTRAFKLQNEAKAFEEKIEEIRKQVHEIMRH